MADKMQDDDFFVRVNNPLEVRKNLLESSRAVLRSMQVHERIRDIRVKKMHSSIRLREVMREVEALMDKLRKALPKTPAKMMQMKKADISAKNQKVEPLGESIPKKKPKPSEIAELENELEDIEKRLTGLDV